MRGVARGGHPIVLEVRLAVALRVFAGASTKDLHILYKIGESTVWQIVRQVIDAINGTAALNFVFPGKNDRAKLDEIAAGFAEKSQGRLLDRCIGAVDGVHCKTLSSGQNTKNYVPRKGYTAILA